MRFPVTADLFAWIRQYGRFHKLYLRSDVLDEMLDEFTRAEMVAMPLFQLAQDRRVDVVSPEEMDTGWLILPERPRARAKA